MTYAELGSARGISAASAKRLAIRRHWRRQAGNDRTARVAVPVTEATPREVKRDDTGDVTSEVAGVITALETAITTLRDQLAVANGRAERAESRAHEAEAGRDGERARADALRDKIEGLQFRLAEVGAEGHGLTLEADELRRQAEAAQIGQAEAEADAAELRQAEAARKGRGRLARLRAAWRGE